MSFGLPVPSHGPVPARICILAEAPGDAESARGVPLVGPSGYELRQMLSTIGVSLDDCRKINTFSCQPQGNNIHLYGTPDKSAGYHELGPLAVAPVVYLGQEHVGDAVDRLQRELLECNPNVIIALGNTACWALGLGTGINALRGAVHTTQIRGLARPVKVVPTYHPAAVLRQWDLRTVALSDLAKAERESHFPDFRFENTELWLNPTLDDLEEFDVHYMRDAKRCACDIETKRGQIDFICFTPEPADVSLSIPFWVAGPNPNYWPSVRDEHTAWRYVHRWMERGDLVKVFQNGLYDLSYIPGIGCTPRACTEDTMLQSHSLYSELQKGLGFLGSIYANTPSWKSMRTFKKEELLKRDD